MPVFSACFQRGNTLSSPLPTLPSSSSPLSPSVRHISALHTNSKRGASSSSINLHLLRNFSSGGGGGGSDNIVSFNLSDIGEGISEVVIKEWFVKEGDKVNQFDSICEVQSDKASVTITSRYDGVIHKIHYAIEDIAKVGKALVDIQLEGTVATGDGKDRGGAGGDRVVDKFEDEYISSAQILTTPAVRRLAMEHRINLKDVVGTGKEGRVLKEDVLNYINMAKQKTPSPGMGSSSSAGPVQGRSLAESTSTRGLPPSAPLSPRRPTSSSSAPLAPKPSAPLPADRVEPIQGITKSMFKTMTQSLSVPHFGLSEEVDMTALVKLRPEMKKAAEERGVTLSYMPFLIKAASLALTEFPILNASIDVSGEKIVYKGAHNIGVAMDTKQGLLVPNIKGVNQLSIIEIAQELNRLHELGKNGQLGTNELTGGTFSLSNIGSIGGVFGIPVLMPAEVAIGAIGRMRQVPRFVDETSDRIERAFVLQVLWSADHRIIDGATMTRFSNRWKSYLESPFTIFL